MGKATLLTCVPCCKENRLGSLFGVLKLTYSAKCRKIKCILAGLALVKIRPLFTVSKHEYRSLFFLPDKHVVLVGELKMPTCGLCMTANKKAALVVKTVCLRKSFSKLRPFLSFCATFLFLLPVTVSLAKSLTKSESVFRFV